MQDRTLRSLARLQNSGATSRILNLHRVHIQHEELAAHREQPFFRNPVLNKALIVKHRLREHEIDLFDDYRTNATKVILPIDRDDLRSGGRYVFVGQRGYQPILSNLLGDGLDGVDDRKTLEILGKLPSFDPFLLREHLRRFDLAPAACYFDVSEGDLRRMFGFLQNELKALVGLSYRPGDGDVSASCGTLAQKILSNSAGEDMEPLRLTLRLDRHDYLEGVFCWKGFLYYKWKLRELTLGAPALIEQIRAVKPAGSAEPSAQRYIAGARRRITEAVLTTRRQVAETLDVYDQAYARLTQSADPVAFRDFLLQAPTMFLNLGEKLGVIDHIVSFWAFRFPPGQPASAPGGELADILMDFEESLGIAGRVEGRDWDTDQRVA